MRTTVVSSEVYNKVEGANKMSPARQHAQLLGRMRARGATVDRVSRFKEWASTCAYFAAPYAIALATIYL